MGALANGTTNPGQMKGAVELVHRTDGSICTGVLISTDTLLTSARCLIKYIPNGQKRFVAKSMFDVFLTGWDTRRNVYWKRCISSPGGPDDEGLCPPPVPGEDPNSGKRMQLDTITANRTPAVDDDLGILTFVGYKWITTTPNDYSDIYIGSLSTSLLPRAKLHGYGNQGTRSAPGIYRNGTMKVTEVATKHLFMSADSARSCDGDLGGPWTIPEVVNGVAHPYAHALVGINASVTQSIAGCSVANTKVSATRISDKLTWVQTVLSSVDGGSDPDNPEMACGTFGSVKRCYTKDCEGAPDDRPGWNGCRGSGCSVCNEQVTAFPNYFINHPNCSRNLTCGGAFYRCSLNCPAPGDGDR